LLDYLALELGVTIEIDYSESNEQIINKFKAGKIDLAYLGPLPYVTLKKTFSAAQPVVVFNEKNGGPFYTCALAVLDESAFNAKSIKNRTIALTQPMSTCGYFGTQEILHKLGSSLEVNRYRYLGQHDEVALGVVRGEFDAGGLKTAIARKYAHLGLIVKAESSPMPGLALVANINRVSAERIGKIRNALLAVKEEMRQTWGENIRNGVVPIKDSDYDVMRNLPTVDHIPTQGNF
jgi:phosphonate transport system substrate-binding protein